jgi:hypothetical protein
MANGFVPGSAASCFAAVTILLRRAAVEFVFNAAPEVGTLNEQSWSESALRPSEISVHRHPLQSAPLSFLSQEIQPHGMKSPFALGYCCGVQRHAGLQHGLQHFFITFGQQVDDFLKGEGATAADCAFRKVGQSPKGSCYYRPLPMLLEFDAV